MHPAPSIIFFTTTSGLGLGLFAIVALAELVGLAVLDRAAIAATGVLGFAAVTAGLAASTLHLANPRNAWRAFLRVRTSWLSREAVLAIAFYPVCVAWLWLRWRDGTTAPAAGLGALTAVLGLATVFTTGMIYACLRTIRQWHTPMTPAIYLLSAIMLGSLLFHAIALSTGLMQGGTRALALGTIVVALAAELAWLAGVGARAPIAAETATGLQGGAVRILDTGHTAGTYLTRELDYRLEPTQGHALRAASIACGYLVPALALALAGGSATAAVVATVVGYAGVLISRWLFFAGASHVVNLYQGARAG